MHGAGAVAVEDEVAAADRAGHEVAIVGQLRAMAEIEPAAIEDVRRSASSTALVGEGAPGDAEQVPAAILNDHCGVVRMVSMNSSFGFLGLDFADFRGNNNSEQS